MPYGAFPYVRDFGTSTVGETFVDETWLFSDFGTLSCTGGVVFLVSSAKSHWHPEVRVSFFKLHQTKLVLT